MDESGNEFLPIPGELQSQLDAIAEKQNELINIVEEKGTELVENSKEQTGFQGNTWLLLLVVLFGIGILIGTKIYHVVRGAWEVS